MVFDLLANILYSYTPSVPICKHHFSLIKGCLHIGTEGVYYSR